MSYYLLTDEKEGAMILQSLKVFNQEELVTICEKSYTGDLNVFLDSLRKECIYRVWTLTSPQYDFTIALKDNKEVEVIKHTQYSIVTFAQSGRLQRVVNQLFATKEEAEQERDKLMSLYGDHLFVAEK